MDESREELLESTNNDTEVRPKRFRNLSSVNAASEEDLNSIVTHEDDSSLLTSLRSRHKQTIEPGSLNVLSAKYESLDYDTCENYLLLDEERSKGNHYFIRKDISRWLVFLLIGMFTALIACVIDIAIEELSLIKYKSLNVDDNIVEGKLYIPYFLFVLYNIVPVLIGSTLVAYVEPIAAGSGIPQVKCYLNGVKVPRVVRIKTLIVKSIGVVCSVVGGLAGGKEGPMIHSGAVVAAGISQGKSTTFKKDFKIFKSFREDHEKRDFVCGGAAAGVSAAFGAPVGGVLFSLEEGSSFWNQSLTWRTFFASVVSTFTLNTVLSAYHGVPGDLSYPGLLNLGKLESISYQIYELPLFMLIGCIGGLLGALWNHVNYKLSVFRIIYLRKRWLRVLEACIVAAMSATIAMLMMFTLNDCKPIGQDPTKYPTQGIYDTHIQLSGVPLLPWDPPPMANNIYASEVMSHPVVTLKSVENVGHIVELLKLTTYNGFPVVDPPMSDHGEVTTYGKIRGLILRSQLIVILQRKIFNECEQNWDEINYSIFQDEYPRYPTIDEVDITDVEKTYSIDLRPFMNRAPYTVSHSFTLPRMFRLFRALGLRHLPIVNDTNEVIGMVTRKDLARYRLWRHQGRMGIKELPISKDM
ncbi:chloride channel protein clc family member [Holotrichia oblita]|uniref:Chloride channel protein clc family member n=1 Tax=Holotrichia oblita TaxID=644536 RepID=A0ACB9SV23_HOLOL|nr:chloride channel protein clc family member [Holotrichia oblita]